MRSSPPNFPFILFNFEYWIIIVDHFQVMECHRELDGQIVPIKEDQMSVCRCDWSNFDLLNHSTNIWSSPLKFVNCSFVSNDMHNHLYKSLNNILENQKLIVVVWVAIAGQNFSSAWKEEDEKHEYFNNEICYKLINILSKLSIISKLSGNMLVIKYIII